MINIKEFSGQKTNLPFSEQYSDIYDDVYHAKDYVNEAERVNQLILKYIKGSWIRLLDFGCGTGRHDVEFCRLGWNVLGVDRSPAMLQKAQYRFNECGASVKLAQALPDEGQYDALVSLFAVLNYIPTGPDLSNLLKKFRKLVRPGGVAVFEVWNGAAVPFQWAQNNQKEVIQPDGCRLIRKSNTKLDWIAQRMDIEFQVHGDSGPQFGEVHSMYYQTPQQFTGILKDSGFTMLEIIPAYQDGPLEPTHFSLLYVCGE